MLRQAFPSTMALRYSCPSVASAVITRNARRALSAVSWMGRIKNTLSGSKAFILQRDEGHLATTPLPNNTFDLNRTSTVAASGQSSSAFEEDAGSRVAAQAVDRQDFPHITTGLREYMLATYKGSMKAVGIWMGTAALCVPAGSFLASISPVLPAASVLASIGPALPVGAWLGAAVYSLYKTWNLDSHSPVLPPKILDADKGIYMEADNPERRRNVSKIMVGMGVISSPLFLVATTLHPLIVPAAGVLALSSCGGATLAAMRRTDTDLTKWQAPLLGGVCALIGVTLVGGGAALAGYPVAMSALNVATSLGGVAIFTALTAADNHAIRADYAEQHLDSAGHGLGLALSFVNIMSDFITLLGELLRSACEAVSDVCE